MAGDLVRRMKTLSPERDRRVALRRNKAIRRSGYPTKWPDEIATSQGWRCFYCNRNMTRQQGPRMLTMDHKLPVSRGGKTSRANLVAACLCCNQAKGQFTIEDFSARQALGADHGN